MANSAKVPTKVATKVRTWRSAQQTRCLTCSAGCPKSCYGIRAGKRPTEVHRPAGEGGQVQQPKRSRARGHPSHATGGDRLSDAPAVDGRPGGGDLRAGG